MAWNLPTWKILVSKINLGSKIKWYSTFEFLGSRTAVERPILQQDPAVNQAIPEEYKILVTLSAVFQIGNLYQAYDQWNFARYRSVLGSQATNGIRLHLIRI